MTRAPGAPGAARRRLVGLVLAAGLVALAGCAGESGGAPTTAGGAASGAATSSAGPSDPVAYAVQILRETNAVRHAEGLRQLGGSVCAQDAALGRAQALVGAAELTHASLTGVISGCPPATTAAENLSRAAVSPAAVVEAWMSSPGHRSNLLDPELTELGVGCAPDGVEMLCSQVYLGP